LIDTPGFDDTTRSDTDILKTIADFLGDEYERGNVLAGVLYFHRISDFRVGGSSARNFNMFQKLCGDTALKNVVLVTNMWGEIDPQLGAAREAELMNDDLFFGPVLDKGAKMARHDNTLSSAQAIIRRILNNHPIPLRIQKELVDEGKDISETSAGEELKREYRALIKKHEEEMRKLREEMEEAARDKDEEARRELEIEARRMQKEMEKVLNDAKKLGSGRRAGEGRFDSHLPRVDEPRGTLRSGPAVWDGERGGPLGEPWDRRDNTRIWLLGSAIFLLVATVGTIVPFVLIVYR